MNKLKLSCENESLMMKVKAFAESLGLQVEVTPYDSILPSKTTLNAVGPLVETNVLQFPVANSNQGKTMSQIEAEAISSAIQANKGNLTSAAKSLGLGRATLYRKVKEYSIDIRDSRIKKSA